MTDGPLVIAHRGASGLAPENTLAAFRRAIEVGVDGIELDVQLTRDGRVVVHHDMHPNPDFARIDGDWLKRPGPALSVSTLDELRHYDVGRIRPGSKVARRYPDCESVDGERIPTLEGVFDLVEAEAHGDLSLWIELKVDPEDVASCDPLALADAVVGILRERGFVERSRLIGFHWPSLRRVRDLDPNIALGFSSSERPWHDTIRRRQADISPWIEDFHIDDHAGSVPQAVVALGGEAWIAALGDLTPAGVAEAHDLGLDVIAWTIRERGDMEKAERLGVDGIITDRPDWYR